MQGPRNFQEGITTGWMSHKSNLSLPPSRVPGSLHYLLAAFYILYSIDYRDLSHWIVISTLEEPRITTP